MLPRPRPKSGSGIVEIAGGADSPLANLYRLLLRDGRDADERRLERERRDAEILVKQRDELLVYSVVGGGALRYTLRVHSL